MSTLSAQHFRRCSSVKFAEHRIEATHAFEPGTKRDFRHGKIGLIQQSFGPLHTEGLRRLQWAGTDMLLEKPGEMMRPHAKARGQMVDQGRIERPVVD